MISCLDASKASCSSVFQRKGTLADSRWRKGAMMGGGGEAEGDLIDGPLPGPYIGDILGSRKVEEFVQELIISGDLSKDYIVL